LADTYRKTKGEEKKTKSGNMVITCFTIGWVQFSAQLKLQIQAARQSTSFVVGGVSRKSRQKTKGTGENGFGGDAC